MSEGKLTREELHKLKQDVLREQESYLCDELGDPGRYFASLRSKDVLSQRDCDQIRSQPALDQKVGEFVKTLITQRGRNDVSSFDVFVEALKKQRVQAHIARSLMKAYAKRKAEKEQQKSCSTSLVDGTQQSPRVAHTPMQATSSPKSKEKPSSETQYDVHPEYGPMPPVPIQKARDNSPVLPSNNVHPTYGVLPPHPPSSSTSPAQPESGGTLPELCETGLRPEPPDIPPGSLSPAHWCSPQGMYEANRVPLDSQQLLQHQLMVVQQENEALKRENYDLRAKNDQLKWQLSGVKDHDAITKELQDLKEKLRTVTLSYREHNYDTIRQPPSDLDDYSRLQEESGHLQKQVAEQHSRLETLEQEKIELKYQVEAYRQQLDFYSLSSSMQSRPQHLPISNPAVLSALPFHEPPSAVDSLGLTPARSLHAGENLLKHSIHVQHSPSERASYRHSASSGEGPQLVGTPLSSSNTSISSHGSGVFRNLSTISQTTIV